jgi:rfaE bifunctional protein nucleotidyltransferase chain/domain
MKIFVNGAFDVLHTGHLSLLFYAKSLGSHLHVALDTDARIAAHKGADRPLSPLSIRKAIISSLKPVDSVSIFDSDQELINTIQTYSPDIMVKGSDWAGKHVIGAEYCGAVIFFDRINGESTTRLIQDYLTRRKQCEFVF